MEEEKSPMTGMTQEEKDEYVMGKAMDIIMSSGDARLHASKAAPSGYQVLKMATRGSARLLGREDIGQLAVGKCADLFLVDSRRLELVGGAYSPADVLATVGLRGPVDYTVVNGRVVVKEGHLVTIDEEKTAADARNACGAYLAKA